MPRKIKNKAKAKASASVRSNIKNVININTKRTKRQPSQPSQRKQPQQPMQQAPPQIITIQQPPHQQPPQANNNAMFEQLRAQVAQIMQQQMQPLQQQVQAIQQPAVQQPAVQQPLQQQMQQPLQQPMQQPITPPLSEMAESQEQMKELINEVKSKPATEFTGFETLIKEARDFDKEFQDDIMNYDMNEDFRDIMQTFERNAKKYEESRRARTTPATSASSSSSSAITPPPYNENDQTPISIPNKADYYHEGKVQPELFERMKEDLKNYAIRAGNKDYYQESEMINGKKVVYRKAELFDKVMDNIARGKSKDKGGRRRNK